MLDAGLRATELLDLTVSNARLQEGFVMVLGIANKENCYLPAGAAQRCSVTGPTASGRSSTLTNELAWLFLNANGQRMTLRMLEEMIGRSGTHAGITDLHPHRLRHTLATRFLTEGLGEHLPTPATPATPAWRWCGGSPYRIRPEGQPRTPTISHGSLRGEAIRDGNVCPPSPADEAWKLRIVN
jgi:hypothetical protein